MAEESNSTSLLERDAELRELDRALEEIAAGTGRLILIEGPPGIGKTRLLGELRRSARRRGVTVLAARTSELDREFPLGVVRQLFQPVLLEADEARRGRLLEGAAAPAAITLADASDPLPDDIGPDDPSLAHYHALYWLIANLADEGPMALAVDDAHWADAGTLRFLRFLEPRLEELPVLLALTTRSAEPGLDRRAIDALATDPIARVIRPTPLTGAAVDRLAEEVFGRTADPEFRAACQKATGGNPFLVGELLRQLAAEHVPPEAGAVSSVGELTPPTVARAVLLRLARLGADATGLARAVAVLGDDAPLRRACALAGLPPDRGAELASELVGADILSAGALLAFAHPVLRSAVYDDIDPSQGVRLHWDAAKLLREEGAGPDEIAVHLLATDPQNDPDVVTTLRQAARTAIARGAPSTGVACLRRALEEPPPVAAGGEVMLELASAELRAGQPAAAAEHFEEGMRIAADPRLTARHSGEYSLALQALGRDDEAFAVREAAMAEVAELDPALAHSIESTLISTSRWDHRRVDWARDRLEPYRGLASPKRLIEWRRMLALAHLDAFTRGHEESADAVAAIAEAALPHIVLADLQRGYASTGFFAGVETLLLADRIEPVRKALDDAVSAMRRRGSAPALVFTSAWRCLLLARTGALAEAEAEAQSYLELALSQGWASAAPQVVGFALGVLLDRGEIDDAEALLARSGMADRPVDDRLAFHPVGHARARIRVARRDLDGTERDLAALARRRARWNTYPSLVPPVLVAPELIASDPQNAKAVADRMLAEARTWGTPRAVGMALRAAGLTAGGDGGIELLKEAVQVLEGSPARLELARGLTDLGAALRRANRRADAREPLRHALELADMCAAQPLAERTRQELRAAGARPRRARITGVQALTPSERRIAAMAAEGLSNREIAQALFVTPKTVEAHLGNAYRKLEIHSRAELAAALQGD